jgi:hypothetical protein
MANKLDARQVESRDVLNQLAAGVADKELDDLLRATDSELTAPFVMRESSPADLTVTIGAVSITNPETNRRRTITPISGVIPTFTSETVTLPATGAGNATPSVGSAVALGMSASQFMKLGVSIDSNGDILLTAGTPGASEAAATFPAPIPDTYSIGYIVVETDGSNNVQNIQGSDIYQYVNGGGGTGSGEGGVNYVANSNFNVNIDGWSATTGTLSQDTSTPIEGKGSLLFTSAASTSIIDGDINDIDDVDIGILLGVEAVVDVDTNAADGDFTAEIYDSTNTATKSGPIDLKPGRNRITTNELGFVADASTTYKFRVKFTDTTASRTATIDRAKVTPDKAPAGAVVTDWESISSPSLDNAPTAANLEIFHRRVGDSIEIEVLYENSATSAATDVIAFDLNTNLGLTVDESKVPNDNDTNAKGSGEYYNTVNWAAIMPTYEPNTNKVKFRWNDASTAAYLQANNFGTAGRKIAARFTLPVSGWDNTVNLMSHGITTSNAYSEYTGGSVTSIVDAGTTDYILLKYDSQVKDDSSLYNSSTGVYTVPATGKYEVTASARFGSISNNNGLRLIVKKNDQTTSSTGRIAYREATDDEALDISLNEKFYLEAGDEISIHISQTNGTTATRTLSTIAAFTRLVINRIPDLSAEAPIGFGESTDKNLGLVYKNRIIEKVSASNYI